MQNDAPHLIGNPRFRYHLVMKASALTLIAALVICSAVGAQMKEDHIVWHDAAGLTVEGRGWSNTETFFCRLPTSAKPKVTEAVWALASNTAGMMVRFTTDASELKVRWNLTGSMLAMNHFAATGVSGVDLYVKYKGHWRWVATGRPSAQENESTLFSGVAAENREFMLYLPLYNGLTKLELGIPDGAKIEGSPIRRTRPVVFYGTSITHGGCASRPGMAYPAIIGRKLDVPTINLGFSGNGKCEREVADLLAELDPSVYVIDPLPNMTEDIVDDNIRYLLKALRTAHPNTPVILVENVIYQYEFIHEGPRNPKNVILEKIYKDSVKDWAGKLYYVKNTKLLGSDGEATVDGVHPTDLGFVRMADVIAPVIQKAMGNS